MTRQDSPKVYGMRICKHCKGICHKDSWRTTFKQRNTYFCCENHVRTEIDNELAKRLEKHGLFRWEYKPMTDEEFADFMRHGHYEKVDVITP